jgi:F-type H+-transporting ATPase subunit b
MDATALATLWAMIALFIFFGIVIYLKVPAMMTKALDERAAKISGDLDEAQKLRQEAQQLLADFQKKRKEAEKEAADMVAAAKRESDLIIEEAHKKTEEYVARRAALAELKIGQAERDAVNEVRSIAVDVATEAARAVLAVKLDEKAGAELFKNSLTALETKLN